jgi:hypothetical protein
VNLWVVERPKEYRVGVTYAFIDYEGRFVVDVDETGRKKRTCREVGICVLPMNRRALEMVV